MSIKKIAESYLNQKEISGNKGFVDKDFDKKMRKAGFYTGAPWCGFFARLVWMEDNQDVSIISGSSKKTIDLATKADNWHAEPVEGAVVVWATFKNGKRQTTGHIGVVTEVVGNRYSTVEGNTTDKGGREGIMVARRFREITPEKWKVENGLRLMGFIHPKEDGEK